MNHDGLRCAAGPDGWLIIRGSLHEPSVSVQTESDVAGGTAAICATLLKYVNEGEGFEVAPLAKAGARQGGPAAAPSGGAAAGGEADGAPPEGFVGGGRVLKSGSRAISVRLARRGSCEIRAENRSLRAALAGG